MSVVIVRRFTKREYMVAIFIIALNMKDQKRMS